MKACILILAHKNESQLLSLVRRLHSDFDIFIHLDIKSKIRKDSFKCYPRLVFTRQFDVRWGGYSQILATVELFKTAFSKGYDYYLLISGQDLPLKSNREIMDFLIRNKTRSYVNFEKLPKREWATFNGGFDRIEYFWGNDYGKSLVGQIIRKGFTVFRYLQKVLGLKRQLHPVIYYGGWNWVNLNREAMTYIFDFLNREPSFLTTFRYTCCADEIWLQSILLNSELEIINNNMRFTVWMLGADHPKTLTMNDINLLEDSEDLFARKFDVNHDAKVIELLYERTL